MKRVKLLVIQITALVVVTTNLSAQEIDANKLDSLIKSKYFVFHPRSASPQQGGSRILDPVGHDLILKGDTVVSYLPFFGRAYAGVPYSDNDGIKFTSTNFSYSYKSSGKGWKITIRPKDVYGIQSLYLDVLINGSSTLQVNSSNRDGISFFGDISGVDNF